MRYLLGRLVQGLLALFGFLTVMFFAVQIIVPGDYFTPLRLGMTQAEVDAVRAEYGLDQSVLVQYWQWVKSLFSGTMGSSTIGQHVSGLLADAIPRTLFVLVVGLFLAFAVGTAQGRWTAWRSGVRSDLVTFVGLAFLTMFPPFLAFALSEYVRQPLRDLRLSAGLPAGHIWTPDPGFTETRLLLEMTASLVGAVAVVGAVLLVLRRFTNARPKVWWLVIASGAVVWLWWWRDGRGMFAADLLFDAAIPTIAFILLSYGEFLLIMQASMDGVRSAPYIETGFAKGLSSRQVRNRHASPNAILPLFARFAVSVPFLMAGLVIIERSVAWPGIGDFLFAAITSQDIPVVMGALAIIGAMSLAVRLVMDVVIVVVDPRVRRP